jgi:hypothetical protein
MQAAMRNRSREASARGSVRTPQKPPYNWTDHHTSQQCKYHNQRHWELWPSPTKEQESNRLLILENERQNR